MSVVNRMLQDIDRRFGEAGLQGHLSHPQVRSVPLPGRSSHGARAARIAIGIGVVGAALAAAWALSAQWKRAAASVAPAPVAVSSTVAGTIRANVALPPEAIVSPQPQPQTQAQPQPQPQPQPEAQPQPQPEAQPQPQPQPQPEPVAEPAPLAREPSLQLSTWLAEMPAVAPRERAAVAVVQSAPPAAPVVSSAKPKAPERVASAVVASRMEKPVRTVAADETVSAARVLWSEGARPAAVATLRDALALAESRANASATAALARELARLEMASNRTQAALDLLRRLEPTLASDADAWALRGNAEQRLALHREAAASYLAALRLRPDEARWMLGAAISLAADGKVAEARGWVANARARGAIPPTVATYLRELGIASE